MTKLQKWMPLSVSAPKSLVWCLQNTDTQVTCNRDSTQDSKQVGEYTTCNIQCAAAAIYTMQFTVPAGFG